MIQTVAVLGQGRMGSGIAHHAAASGFDVLLWGRNPEHVRAAVEDIRASLSRQVSKGKLDAGASEQIMGRIRPTGNLADTAGADLLIEAIAEDPTLKKTFFKELEALVRPDAILATNTSSISVTQIASGLREPGRAIGMHFFNPVPAMKLVEIVMGGKTSEDTYAAAKAFCDRLEKISVKVRQDSPGFIVNRVLFAYFLECIHLYEEGVASKEDIDLALRYGLNHPLGPFALMDMGGLDLFPNVCESLQAIDQSRFSCPESVKKLAETGKFGQKSGEGWYSYHS